MRRALLAPAFALLLACHAADPGALGKHVVSLHVTHQSWDERRPWAKSSPSVREAFAAVVEGPALLTVAQMIADSTLIQVERSGDGRLWNARVQHADPRINLALVTVDDAEFFEGLEPVRFADALPTEGFVRSLRWRSGQLETLESRVEHFEVLENRYELEHLFLWVHTDVAGGGWSEPVFTGGELAGLTSSQGEDQRAAIIPPELLRAYLEAARSGAYRGFASLDLVWQYNRDRSLAAYLGLEGPPRGVIVRAARSGGSSCGVLEPRDVLLELDGQAIDGVGNYEHPVYGRIRFTHIAVDGHMPGDEIVARVLRDGEVIELPMELRSYAMRSQLVPWQSEGVAPPYLVAGGLVFRELNGAYVRTFGEQWRGLAPLELVHSLLQEAHGQSAERRRIVVLSGVLPDSYNLGYHDVHDRIVERANGVPIDSIADLDRAFAAPVDGFHTIALAANGERREIVLDAAELRAATQRVMASYGVPQASRIGFEERGPIGPVCGPGY